MTVLEERQADKCDKVTESEDGSNFLQLLSMLCFVRLRYLATVQHMIQ